MVGDEITRGGVLTPASETQSGQTATRPFGTRSALATPGLLNRMGRGLAPQTADALPEMELVGHSQIRERVELEVRSRLAHTATPTPERLRDLLAAGIDGVLAELGRDMPDAQRRQIIDSLVQDMLGLGPLDELLADPTVTEIMVNGHTRIYVERGNRMQKTSMVFESERHLMQVIDRIVARVGRRIDELSPTVDARLDDGSRVHIIIPPLALTGPTITIRRFAPVALTADDLVEGGTMTQEMSDFLRACVKARISIAVCGGGSSGKTTTLNVLSSFIDDRDRIVTIEDAAELQLEQIHLVPLESRPANVEGRGRVTIRDLVVNALRMRPDRIVVGEVRGGEALDMLQAMNTGHDGSLTTLHANSPRDALSRLETMVLMAGTALPSRAIRDQIGSAIGIIVHQARGRDGVRRITSITEVLGCDAGEIRSQEIYRFTQVGFVEGGPVQGQHEWTGNTPECLDQLRIFGELEGNLGVVTSGVAATSGDNTGRDESADFDGVLFAEVRGVVVAHPGTKATVKSGPKRASKRAAATPTVAKTVAARVETTKAAAPKQAVQKSAATKSSVKKSAAKKPSATGPSQDR